MSNWEKMKAAVVRTDKKEKEKKRKLANLQKTDEPVEEKEAKRLKPTQVPVVEEVVVEDEEKQAIGEISEVLGIDGEFVGVGAGGRDNSLARISIVNFNGEVVYDTFVLSLEDITDYRTEVSGVRPKDMLTAVTFKEAQERFAKITKNRVIVGHSVANDLKVLRLTHPPRLIRDLTRFSKFCPRFPQSLKLLAEKFLGKNIQEGEHSSVIDAQISMELYKLHRKEWEKEFVHVKYKKAKVGKVERVKKQFDRNSEAAEHKLLEAAKAIEMC